MSKSEDLQQLAAAQRQIALAEGRITLLRSLHASASRSEQPVHELQARLEASVGVLAALQGLRQELLGSIARLAVEERREAPRRAASRTSRAPSGTPLA